MQRRNTSLRTGVALLLLCGTIALAGCGGDSGAEGTQPADTNATGGESTQLSFDLKIGVVAPFTGDIAWAGPAADTGARIAVDIASEALERADFSDASVSVVATEDDQSSATAGVEAATKLVQTDGVHMIMGPIASSVAIPIAESVTIPNRVVQISPSATAPAISELDDDGFVWRTPPSDALQGKVLARAMASEFGATATVNTGALNDAYGTGLTNEFEKAWKEGGGTIGKSVRWNPEAPTFDSEARELASGSPDGWMIIDVVGTWAKFGPALVRTQTWDPARTFTADGLRDAELPEKVGREATEGIRGTAPTSVGAPAADAFSGLWDERSEGTERQTFDSFAFDAVLVTFLAAVSGGSSDPTDIRDHLQAVSGPPGTQYTFEQLDDAITALVRGDDIDYEGASGPINFDEKGDPSSALYEIWTFQNGTLETTEAFPYEE